MKSADEREVNGVESIKEKTGTTGPLNHSRDFMDGQNIMRLGYQ